MRGSAGGAEAVTVEPPSSQFRERNMPLLIAGVAAALLVAVCTASVWFAGAPLRAGVTTGQGTPRLFVPCLWGAFAAYLVGLALIRRGRSSLWAAVTVAVVIQLLPLFAPLLGSTDAWSYWDYARIAAVHGANPYAIPPTSFPGDPAYGYMPGVWHRTTSVYGPAFTLASEPVALIARSSATTAAWMFKLLGAAAVLVASALAGFLANRKVFAIAFVGWNPLLALDFAGGGHNDAWMAALVLAALALAATGRRRLSALAWTAASFAKWIPLLLLPLHLLEQRAKGQRVRYLTLGALNGHCSGDRERRVGPTGLAQRPARAPRPNRLSPRHSLPAFVRSATRVCASDRSHRTPRRLPLAHPERAPRTRPPRSGRRTAPDRNPIPRLLVHHLDGSTRRSRRRRHSPTSVARTIRLPPAPRHSILTSPPDATIETTYAIWKHKIRKGHWEVAR